MLNTASKSQIQGFNSSFYGLILRVIEMFEYRYREGNYTEAGFYELSVKGMGFSTQFI